MKSLAVTVILHDPLIPVPVFVPTVSLPLFSSFVPYEKVFL